MLESRSSSAFATFKSISKQDLSIFDFYLRKKRSQTKSVNGRFRENEGLRYRVAQFCTCLESEVNFFLSEGLHPFTQNRDTKFTIKMILKTWATLNPLQKA